MTSPTFPFALTRAGVIMSPEPGNELEAEGVLNPATVRGADGTLYLLPRLVAAQNVSRIGLAEIKVADGVPVSVAREGVLMAPDRSWEHGAQNAGVEDPRVTFIPELGLNVMTYVAYGPLGPRTALAVSEDERSWRRLGPVSFAYDDDAEIDVDLGLYPNKDAVFFPEVVRDPEGVPSFAVLHRPVWDLQDVRPGEVPMPPAGLPDERPSIWISFIPVEDVRKDVKALARWSKHRVVAWPEAAFEQTKIGSGPAPIRVDEGWLLLYHGVTGQLVHGVAQQKNVNYSAAAMILDAEEPWRVTSRTSEPLLSADTEDERDGIVPNVVFPTAIEEVDGTLFVFYGMADSKIGVAKLERV
ncbi:glycosidase [Paenarthrobacter sp. DKR-5]|uniref:glycoside hydrolase family 130 protein n=1 Tax=Paenarthrobacter sp. DKR-5 TaxID=2835535 RepID=UPI001BDC5D5A|nr:glycosidase [Paenarthrobacter sp. DKR-5]MBT1002227.1 glycosidase [Paenarthrobacter sp. DKR-5]